MIEADTLSAAEARLEAEQQRRLVENKLKYYAPYAKQAQFHEAGATHRERLLMTCNRFGKTVCGAAEMAFHLTGLYPSWWAGKTFDKAVRAWAAGVTSETTRDVVQEKLIGPPTRESEWGTGYIPKHTLGSITPARGVPGALDTVGVAHVSGRYSLLQFKSYERGREKWQGVALEVVWMDEECPTDIYFEALTRTNETGGIVYITMTPVLGMSDLVRMFLQEQNVIRASIDDAEHLT
jgi:phage terminase large subunit-like protein